MWRAHRECHTVEILDTVIPAELKAVYGVSGPNRRPLTVPSQSLSSRVYVPLWTLSKFMFVVLWTSSKPCLYFSLWTSSKLRSLVPNGTLSQTVLCPRQSLFTPLLQTSVFYVFLQPLLKLCLYPGRRVGLFPTGDIIWIPVNVVLQTLFKFHWCPSLDSSLPERWAVCVCVCRR